MFFKNILKTLVSKFFILIINFALVILTTNLWGAEGRGIISILVANMAIIAILNNVLGGYCITYFTPKIGFEKLVLPAYIWIILVSIVSSVITIFIQGHDNAAILILLTILNSLFTVQLFLFTAKGNFKLFNIFSLLQPLLLLLFALFFEYIFKVKSFKSYLYGYIAALSISWLFSLIKSRQYLKGKRLEISFKTSIQVMKYGWQTELSSFLQFLSYRLSYFFILFYKGFSSVGVFSVGIALTEAIWMISRSISTVQFSQIINNIEFSDGIKITKQSAKLSFVSSLFILIVMILLPASVFKLVFGHSFEQVKEIMIFLFPGIIAIAISNIYGHFFSATGKTVVLIIKSVFGLFVTVIVSVLLIPRFGIVGACLAASASYLASSIYLFVAFYKNTKFHYKDLIISKNEIKDKIVQLFIK